MTATDIARLRLHNQLITRPVLENPGDVVRHLGAVQAQDYLASLWAIGLRLPKATEADIEQAITERQMVRTWPMRGTIHYVAPEDVRWMLGLLTPRVIARSAGRYRELELDQQVFARSREVLTQALQGGKALSRNAIYEALGRAGISTASSRGLHILGHLAQQGLICFGPRAGKQPTFVLLDEWVPKSRTLGREEALAELARRYFESHGPATLQDFMWWSGLTAAEAKAGLGAVEGELAQVRLEGSGYWFAQGPRAKGTPPTAHLLPFFDEFLVAYKDRSAALEALYLRQVNAGGGLLNPTVVLEGRVVGTWKRTLKKNAVQVALSLFAPLGKAQIQAIEAAAERYRGFLGLPLLQFSNCF